jgi:uncharacterized Zn-finger protein
MDKHDRPYKCTIESCKKRQGFTSNSDLLRHKREVHSGSETSLFCPFGDCKRSSGNGFKRKENLAEHVRSVHRKTSSSADMQGSKRKKAGSDSDISDHGSEKMWKEIKRLKQKNEETASLLTQLKKDVMALQKQYT